MTTPHVLWLDEIEDADRARVGGKAFALAKLRRAGLPVPDGFVLTASGEPLAGERRQALIVASERLPGAVAVRSSSTAEDLETASYAGQYRTLLDVRGSSAIAEAAALCLDSTGDAAGYARAVQAPAAGAMAVLVQRFVEPRAAGVVFTRHPRDPGRMLVESHAGRGEALVSGRVTPDRYALDRANGAVLQAPALGGLDGPTLAAVAELARRVEAFSGAPQDVEWAAGPEGVVLLQARPITVEAEEAGQPRLTRLTRANVGEVLPGPVTPLTETTVVAFLEHGFHEVARQAGLRPAGAGRFLAIHRRRLYLNLPLCIELAARLPGSSPADAERLILGGGATHGASAGFVVEWGFRTVAIGARLLRLAAGLPHAVRRCQDVVAALPPAAAIVAADAAALARMLREAGAAGRTVARTHIAVSGSSAFRLTLLGRLIDDGAAEASARVNRLVAGLDGIESAGPALALESIAARARRTPEWAAWLAQATADGAAREAWRLAPSSLAAELRTFLDRYGHRAVAEGELSAAAWEDDPTPLLTALQGLLRTPRSADFTRRARAEVRGADEEALLSRRSLLRRAVLRQALRGAQDGVRQRERTKSLAVALVRHVRHLARAAGRRLAQDGVLAREDDVFFLTIEELLAALEGRPVPAAVVARRRRRQEREAALPAPREVDLADPDAAPEAVSTPLAGVGVSAGVAVGRARVLEAGTAPRAEPGEVIVASVLDAALGPLLATAAGAVAEIGGLLSHGAVVARELGVPCVVDVRDATLRIRTGDRILVDGGRGRVEIVAEPGAGSTAAPERLAELRPADAADEAFHPLEADPRARESVYLNVQDPSNGLALVVSLGVKHGGRGEGVIALALPDGRVLFGLELGRPRFEHASVKVGGLSYAWDRLTLTFEGALAPHASASFPPAPLPLALAPRTVRVQLALTCAATTPAVDFCDGLPADDLAALRPLGSHHVEQSGVWRGTLELDGRRVSVDGTGSRDHSWGLRDWEAADHWRLFTVRLADDFAAHALAVSVCGVRVEGGFLWRAGRLTRVRRVEHVSQRDEQGRLRSLDLELSTDRGDSVCLHGTPARSITVPLQLERRLGRHLRERPYRLLLHENYTRWEAEGRTGHGIAEYTERPP